MLEIKLIFLFAWQSNKTKDRHIYQITKGQQLWNTYFELRNESREVTISHLVETLDIVMGNSSDTPKTWLGDVVTRYEWEIVVPKFSWNPGSGCELEKFHSCTFTMRPLSPRPSTCSTHAFHSLSTLCYWFPVVVVFGLHHKVHRYDLCSAYSFRFQI